jgi:hypothetical protein
MQSPLVQIGYLLLPTLWAGLLVGVCFIATPAKFMAHALTRPVALEVGRATFTIWNNAEWLVLAVMVPPLLLWPMDRFFPVATLFLCVLLLIQSAVLLPALNARTVAIIAGGHPPPSSDHRMYIAMDVVKLVILAAIVCKQGERLLEMFAPLH